MITCCGFPDMLWCGHIRRIFSSQVCHAVTLLTLQFYHFSALTRVEVTEDTYRFDQPDWYQY